MKQIYSRTFVVLVFIAASIPHTICTVHMFRRNSCNSNYNSYPGPTNLPSATITFPQFNPTTNPGFDLSCVTMFDTLTIDQLPVHVT